MKGVLGLAMGVCLWGAACCPRALGEDQPVVAGYFTSWGIYERNYHVTNVPAAQLTHLIYAFAKPTYDPIADAGGVVSFDPFADVEKLYPGDIFAQPLKGNFNQLRKLKLRYPHLKTLISVGGWTLSSLFSDIAASSNARLTFAASCVHFMTNYGFDGVDVDWEFPVEGGAAGVKHRPEDADNFVLLLQAMRARLDAQAQADGRPYLLTIATDGDPRHLATRYRIAATAATVDWISDMTYNFAVPADRRTGHNAPLYTNPGQPYPELTAHGSLTAYLTNGVPREKLVMGVPFFGRGYKDVAPTNSGLYQFHGGVSQAGSWEPGVFDYRDLRDGVAGNPFIHTGGFSNFWDTYTLTPHLYNPTSQVFISYDNEASIGFKAAYARSNALRGMMIWSLDSDTADRALLRSLYRILYPFEMNFTTNAAQPRGMSLSWQGWTGQVYRVRVKDALADANWVNPASLVDSSGVPVSSVPGGNARIVLIDTNAVDLPRRFYTVAWTNAAP